MNRNLPSAIAVGAVTTMALLAAAVIASTPAYADEDQFVSTRTREEVTAELKTPYPGGNPWSGSYNMFQAHSSATREEIQGEYIMNRDRVNAFNAEDSGSAYLMKEQASPASSYAGTTGAPAR